MQESKLQDRAAENTYSTATVIIAGGLSVAALFLTFAVSNIWIPFPSKAILFALIITGYVSALFVLYFRGGRISSAAREPDTATDDIFDRETEEKLMILEEAGEFFGASLRSKDMFRLLSSRVGEIVPYDTCLFMLLDEENRLTTRFVAGRKAVDLRDLSLDCDAGLPGKAFVNRVVQIEEWSNSAPSAVPAAMLKGLSAGAAVPLVRGGEAFAVMVLFSVDRTAFDERSRILLEAIGERITPLITSSLSFERSLSNALTDTLTDLPNERAFYLVLENQIAEAQRFRGVRSLSVIAADIRDFEELNKKYGHGIGDDVLAFAAALIKRQLREMDLIARIQNDQFLVILPTASEKTSRTVIKRINSAFAESTYPLPDDPGFRIRLSFGTAMFERDGDTARRLVQSAVNARSRAKANFGRQVLKFPTEHSS